VWWELLFKIFFHLEIHHNNIFKKNIIFDINISKRSENIKKNKFKQKQKFQNLMERRLHRVPKQARKLSKDIPTLFFFFKK